MDYQLFDANCQVGPHLRMTAGQPFSVSDLLIELDHIGVAEALVIDCLSRESHPADGNARILSAAAAHARLHPAWAAMPHAPADEQLQGDALLTAMRQDQVGAIFLYPEQYKFTLSDWAVDAFLEPLAATGVPVFINYNEIGQPTPWDETNWDAVVALCRRWPKLPVVVSEDRMRRRNRLIYRALEACPNLRIELSGYWLHRGIEYITEHWGADRLVFGSNWPHTAPAAAVATVTGAEISDADKKLIGGDNLRQLIKWCEPEHPEVDIPPAADPYVLYARTGERPDDMPLFADNHGHMGGRASHYHLPDCDLEGIVADIRRHGIRKSIIFGFSGIFSDEQPGNDVVAEAVRTYPDLFVGFTMLNANRGPDAMLAECERGKAMGLKGVKLIAHYQCYPEEGPNIDVACQWAHDNGQIILNHNWGSPEQMARLLEAYPNACFFTGHSSTAYAELMQDYGNLFVCSCPLHTPGACEAVVAAIGADRLLFGSDLQDLPISWGLGPILFARISVAEKQLILGDNLLRVLSRYGIGQD